VDPRHRQMAPPLDETDRHEPFVFFSDYYMMDWPSLNEVPKGDSIRFCDDPNNAAKRDDSHENQLLTGKSE
jgi:hypothetical protein